MTLSDLPVVCSIWILHCETRWYVSWSCNYKLLWLYLVDAGFVSFSISFWLVAVMCKMWHLEFYSFHCVELNIMRCLLIVFTFLSVLDDREYNHFWMVYLVIYLVPLKLVAMLLIRQRMKRRYSFDEKLCLVILLFNPFFPLASSDWGINFSCFLVGYVNWKSWWTTCGFGF